MKREVFYTLERAHRRRGTLEPVATYPRYVEAYEDGLTFHNRKGFHMVIKRHSLPIPTS